MMAVIRGAPSPTFRISATLLCVVDVDFDAEDLVFDDRSWSARCEAGTPPAKRSA